MYNIEDMLMEKNYSKCPLKKRPIYYNFDGDDSIIDTQNLGNIIVSFKMDSDEPENLSLKKEKCELLSSSTEEELISINDCCEDEGVDVDHTDDDSVCNDEDEVINCVDVEDNHNEDANKTQAAALSAAAAVAAASVTVVVPTPTYPEYVLKPWNFHINSYTAEFYRSMSNPHLTKQISPLSGELLSPSSPPDSIGSLSPPPHHYLHGRSNSVSPPMRVDMAHRSLGARQLSCQIAEHHNQQRFISYPLSGYPTHHQPSLSYAIAGYPPQRHHAPISPAYSDSSYYSMRSLTPESLASPLPEDLSLKASSCNSIKDYQKANKHKMKEVETATAFQQTTAALSAGTQGIKEKSGSPRYQCPDCLKSYSTFSGLTKHQQFHCPAAERNQVKKSFSCKDCDKTYVTLGALKMHIRTHTLPCKCNICGKAFSRPWLLQGHIRTHTGEKPFSCQHCFRAFADRSNLRAHLQTHSDIKKYSCSHCSKTFSRMSLLTKHSEGGCQGSSNSANAPNSSTVSINGYPVYNKN